MFTAAVPFEAARRISVVPLDHRARRVHGHSFLAKLRTTLPVRWASFPGGEVDELRMALEKAIEPLDYQSLNDGLPEPTDENLTRWVRSAIRLPTIETVGIQSTMHQGADLDTRYQVHLWRRYILQAAHRLPHVPLGHKCGRMHGHGFEVILHANQDIGDRPIGVTYEALDALWAPIHEELDHACLNDIAGLENPTSEMISAWLWRRLEPELPELSWVTVFETAQCGASFDGDSYRIWKELTLDSAVQLNRAPEGDRRRRIFGHTFTLRLHLNAPLDTVMGWTMDFGDVKELFGPIFEELDHQPLYELSQLEHADTASLARWIRQQAASTLPQLDRLDLYETRGCGVILKWGADDVALPI
jgi:6-pyruvoyltetrahydropterin/6-carboxytetrahydropterin synthase